MNPLVTLVALVVTAGAVLAVSSGNGRTALLGLAIAVAAAPFIDDPFPQPAILAMRVVGAALAAYLLRSAVAAASPTSVDQRQAAVRGGSRLGWPAEALMALAAWLVAIVLSANLAALQPTGAVGSATDLLAMLGPAGVTTAAGLASIAVGLVPALAGRDALRTAAGSLILVQGALIFRSGIAGAPSDLEQIAGVALFVATAVAGAVLIGIEDRPESASVSTAREPATRRTPLRRRVDA
ncbi:MAG: hypothetical protein ABIQ17_05640 [Candidatus Limnocylindrales bacterium]